MSRLSWAAMLGAARIACVAALSACAAAPPMNEPSAPTAAGYPPPAEVSVGSMSSVDDALAELDRAESELAMLLPGDRQREGESAFAQAPGSESAAGRGPVVPAAPPPPPPTSPPADAAEKPQSGDAAEPRACALACRALGSMQRATERLCDLAGGDSDRCDSAKKRVEAAEARVAPVCSDCEG